MAPTEDADGRWSIGEVLDLGEKGRFIVKERLGRGGIGEVYRADYVTALMMEYVGRPMPLDQQRQEVRTRPR